MERLSSKWIRRKNLHALKGQMTSKELADKLDRSESQVSRILSNTPIGDRLAMHIEKCFDKERGWLDYMHLIDGNEPANAYSTFATVGEEPGPGYSADALVYVDRVRGAELAAGTGEVLWELDEVEGSHAFQREYMAQRGLRPDSCKIWKIRGASMEPHYRDGGVVLINMREREPRHAKVFALVGEDGLRVKQLRRGQDGTWWMYSFNPDQETFPPEPIVQDDYAIIGRVRWYAADED